MPINFVEIPLDDPSYRQCHEDLDVYLTQGWEIIGHAVYINTADRDLPEPMERYTLYCKSTEKIIEDADAVLNEITETTGFQFDTPETVDAKMQQAMSLVNHLMKTGS
ncbi:MAG: hypothetical protein AAF846_22295 [Chloroflexota bacterium]